MKTKLLIVPAILLILAGCSKNNESPVEKAIKSIISIQVVTDEDDGSVRMTAASENEISFKVVPAEAIAAIVDAGTSTVSLDAVVDDTKASVSAGIPVSKVVGEEDCLKIIADGSGIPEDVIVGAKELQARLVVSAGSQTCMSEYFKLGFAAPVTTSDATATAWNAATLSGSLSAEGLNSPVRSAWFLYSTAATTLSALQESGSRIDATLEGSSFTANATELFCETEYCYVACAEIYDRTVYGEVKTFTLHLSEGPAVDMGLSVWWATCNLGASNPWEYGGFYQWAGTTEIPSTGFYLDWDGCPYHEGSDPYSDWTRYSIDGASPDNLTTLQLSDDAARVNLKGSWRMPTDAEWKELINNSSSTWTQINGVNGRVVTSNKEGYTDRSIFLPTHGQLVWAEHQSEGSSGYYWSSTLDSTFTNFADVAIVNEEKFLRHSQVRYAGLSVRPVLPAELND